MKKKVIAGLLLSSCVLGVAMPAFAQDGTEADLQEDYSGVDSVDIEVNGTLGADNTDPGATIPEGDDNWINVTVPTKTIFIILLRTQKLNHQITRLQIIRGDLCQYR